MDQQTSKKIIDDMTFGISDVLAFGKAMKENCNYDVVIVQGIIPASAEPCQSLPDRFASLEGEKDSHLLPDKARIMMFNYKMDEIIALGISGIDAIAGRLLKSIDQSRRINDRQRSILFIGHSFGGLIIKQALVSAENDQKYKAVYEKTSGIIFLGTPHRRTEKCSLGQITGNIAQAYDLSTENSKYWIKLMKSHNQVLEALADNFQKIISDIRIINFFEAKQTITSFGILSDLGIKSGKILVSRQSASIGVTNEECIPLLVGHRALLSRALIHRDPFGYLKLSHRVQMFTCHSVIDNNPDQFRVVKRQMDQSCNEQRNYAKPDSIALSSLSKASTQWSDRMSIASTLIPDMDDSTRI